MGIADYVARIHLDSGKALKELNKFDSQAQRVTGQTEKRFSKVGDNLSKGIKAGAVVAAGSLVGIIKIASDLEAGFIGVRKTTGLSAKQIKVLKNNLLEFSTTAPVSVSNLIEIAKVAGQLGISSVKDIERFTKTFAKLEIASDRTISGELGAQQFARFLENSGAGVAAAENVASAFTYLGNTSKLTEGQLLSTALEISKVSKTFDLNAAAVLGLATTFTELSVAPEVARTTTLRFFKAVQDAVVDGKGLDSLQAITGLTVKQLEELRKTKPEKILVAFAKGLKRAKDSGTSLTGELKKLGLNGTIVFSAISALSNGSEKLANKVDDASKAYRQNIALSQEAAIAGKSFQSEVTKLSNSFVLLGDAIAGSGLIDFLSFLTQAAAETVKEVSQLIDNFKLLAEHEGVSFTANKGQTKSRAQFTNRQAIGLANSIDSPRLQELISRNALVLNNPEFIYRIEKRGLLNEKVREQIRNVRNGDSRIVNPSAASSTNNKNVTINQTNNFDSGTPRQDARQIIRTTENQLGTANLQGF